VTLFFIFIIAIEILSFDRQLVASTVACEKHCMTE